jgi:transposase
VEVPVARGRVIIAPLPPEKQPQAIKRLKRKASRKNRKLTPEALQVSGFLFLFCSDASLSAEEAVALYRWRWQIELLFKRLKSLQGIDEMALKSPPLIRVYLLCHALVALLAQRIRQKVEASFPPEALEAAVSLAALAIPLPCPEASVA